MLCERRVAVTVISWSASGELSALPELWSAAAAANDEPPKIAAIAKDSFVFMVIPSFFVERAINRLDMSRFAYLVPSLCWTQWQR
jgi:hypothetical protein